MHTVMNIKRYISAFFAAAVVFCASAQGDTTPGLVWSALHALDYEVFAGVNIGGTSPIPLPAEIRSIDSYNPNLNLQLGAKATKWLGKDKKGGIGLGIIFESKGMKTKATVKNYGMEIIQEGSRLKGNWTGRVQTRYSSSLLTLPLTANYKINSRLKVSAGPYIGIAMNSNFDGYVYDGYLRENDPTGNKVSFEGDSRAAYDFSDDIRAFQWGAQAGVSWLAFRHLSVNANLTWGCNGIFKSSFKTITFTMYPIYLNLGFGYAF